MWTFARHHGLTSLHCIVTSIRSLYCSNFAHQTKAMSSSATVLRQNYLFRGLTDASVGRIAKLSIKHSFKKNEVIFMQGDQDGGLYSVTSGQIRISTSGPDGKEVFLNILEPGDTFGEIALIDGKPRTATATAMTDVDLIVLERHRFLELMEREPKIAIHLLQVFCDRVRWTSGLIEDTALLTVPARVAKRLLVLSDMHGVDSENGRTLAISQGELAQFLNISRQIVNQYLQVWRERGWIALSRGKITVCDQAALETVAAKTGAD